MTIRILALILALTFFASILPPRLAAEEPERVVVEAVETEQREGAYVVVVGERADEWAAFVEAEMENIMIFIDEEIGAPTPNTRILVLLEICGGHAYSFLIVGGCAGRISNAAGHITGSEEEGEETIGNDGLVSTLIHEYWHKVQFEIRNMSEVHLPWIAWISEGEASYIEHLYRYRSDAREMGEVMEEVWGVWGDLCEYADTIRSPQNMNDPDLPLEDILKSRPYEAGERAMHWLFEHAEKVGAPGHLAYWRELARTGDGAFERAQEAGTMDGKSPWDGSHPIRARAELAAFEHAFGISRAKFFETACTSVESAP